MVACQRLGCDVTGFLHFEAERRGRYGGETEGVGGVVDEECASGRESQWCCPVLSAPTMHRTGRAAPAFRVDLRKNLEKRVPILCSSPNTLDNNDYLIERG